jgi:hypothetical protein
MDKFKIVNKLDRSFSNKYWMTPTGKLVSMGGKNHVVFAFGVLDRKYNKEEEIYKEMFKLGFIRLYTGYLPNSFTMALYYEYDAERGIKPSQFRELKNIAIENELRLIDDTKFKEINLMENSLNEIPYPGNLGYQEVVTFYMKAHKDGRGDLIKQLNDLLDRNDLELAWNLIQSYTNVTLIKE